jgi:predicted membrane protein
MFPTNCRIGPIAIAFGCALALPAFAATYVTFAVPGAQVTNPIAINSNGDVVGNYGPENAPFNGFVRTSDGTITTFNVPGATDTYVSSINDQGVIVGTWDAQDEYYLPHGFVRSASGVITTFDPPGAYETMSAYISSNGTIAGTYYPGDLDPQLGYIMSSDGSFAVFTAPFGQTLSTVGAINVNGDVAGSFTDRTLFVRYSNGSLSTTTSGIVSGFIYVYGLNTSDQVVGTDYYSAGDIQHYIYINVPFLWANGSVNRILPSSGPDGGTTDARGINDNGDVAGSANGYGFLRASDGLITFFQVNSQPTGAAAINDSGVITGTTTTGSTISGYLRMP